MSSPLVANWYYATVRVESPGVGTGSGFLVSRMINKNEGKVFLVTNKHVIHPDAAERSKVTELIGGFNTGAIGNISGSTRIRIPTRDGTGIPLFKEHPDTDTDVVAFDITPVVNSFPAGVVAKWVPYDMFADSAKRKEQDITAGEEIVTLGYPLGLMQGKTSLPLIRQGILATEIGQVLGDEVRLVDGSLKKRSLRAFLVDGATVPGSSGSPVVLKPTATRFFRDSIQLGSAPPLLLGIIAETRYAPHIGPKGVPTVSFAGLGMAFEAETIKETVEAFFP